MRVHLFLLYFRGANGSACSPSLSPELPLITITSWLFFAPVNQPLSSRTRCQETRPTSQASCKARWTTPAPIRASLSSCPIPSHSSVVVYPSLGAFCESPGKPYDGLPSVANPSTCGGRVQECHERGPVFTEDAYGFASSAEIGARQVRTAGVIVRVRTGKG
jgi:hypothetical protein